MKNNLLSRILMPAIPTMILCGFLAGTSAVAQSNSALCQCCTRQPTLL